MRNECCDLIPHAAAVCGTSVTTPGVLASAWTRLMGFSHTSASLVTTTLIIVAAPCNAVPQLPPYANVCVCVCERKWTGTVGKRTMRK